MISVFGFFFGFCILSVQASMAQEIMLQATNYHLLDEVCERLLAFTIIYSLPRHTRRFA